jgi:hypothetical protein
MFWFDCLVMVASIAGALLASSASQRSRKYGYAIWLFSNGAIGLAFWQEGNVPMTIAFAAYEILNIRGLKNNW